MNSPVIAKVLAALCLTWVSFTAQLATAQVPPVSPLVFQESIATQIYRSGDPVYTRLPEVTGGFGVVNYRIEPPLPEGLSLVITDRGPKITGAPTMNSAAQTFDYIAMDSNGDTTSLQPTITTASICERTQQVQNAILSAVSLTECNEVTTTYLASIMTLDLGSATIDTLLSGDFSGLSSLNELHLSNNMLTTLPESVFNGLINLGTLDLSGNQLTTLLEGLFSGLTNLEVLVLNNNELTTLPESVFSGLNNLRTLRLGENELASLSEAVLSDLSNLNDLTLNNNRMTTLPGGVFNGLSKLNVLRMSGNDLTTLPEGVFSGISNLTRLWLFGNQLTSLPEDVFSGLSSLALLRLHSNPGAPFRFELQLERIPDIEAVQVRLPQGAPLPITVLLSVDPSSGAQLSTAQVVIPTGAITSEPVTVSVSEGSVSDVTVRMVPEAPTEDTSDARGSYTGFAIVAPLLFVDGVSTTLSVLEDSGAGDLVGTVAAVGGAGGLTYQLIGDAEGLGAFAVAGSSGEVSVKAGASLDHETTPSYTLTVEVSDELGVSTTIALTINVSDVDELPGKPVNLTVAETTAMSLTVSWEEPVNTGPEITRYEVQYKKESEVFSPAVEVVDADTLMYVIEDLEAETTYDVRVRAVTAEGTGEWAEVQITTPEDALRLKIKVLLEGAQQ